MVIGGLLVVKGLEVDVLLFIGLGGIGLLYMLCFLEIGDGVCFVWFLKGLVECVF